MRKGSNTARLFPILLSTATVASATLVLLRVVEMPPEFTAPALFFLLGITAIGSIISTLLPPAEPQSQARPGYDLLDDFAHALLIFDDKGNCEYANPAALKTLHRSTEETISKHFSQLLRTKKPGKQEEKSPLAKAFESDLPHLLKGVTLHTDSGEMHLNIFVTPYSHDGVRKTIALLRNITNKDTVKKMSPDFAAMAAHELRTPTTSIRGYLELLLNEASYYLQPAHREFAQRALGATNRLSDLMSNLLLLPVIERDELSPEIEEFDINELIQQVVSDYEPDAKEKGLRLAYVHTDEDVPYVKADRKYTKRAVSNLVSNAINYSAKGAVVVSLHPETGNGRVRISVKDPGQGIPEELLPKLFENITETAVTLERAGKGTGLGLFVAHKLVESQNGRMAARINDKRQTVISIDLITENNFPKDDADK